MRWQRLTLMMLLALMTRKTWARRLRRRFTASNLQSSRWVGRHRTHLMERIDVHLEINVGLAASPRNCARLSYWPTPPVHSVHLVNCAKLHLLACSVEQRHSRLLADVRTEIPGLFRRTIS